MSVADGGMPRYIYDAVGNMTAKTQNGVQTAMSYNAANQLIQSVKGGEATTYTYDANGNLVKSENAAGARSYAYNARNLLATFTREDGYSESYTYNAQRLLSTVTTSENVTTTLTYDILYGDGVVIGAAKNGEETRFAYGLERISAISGSTRTEYLHDGRGSVAAELIYNGNDLTEVTSKSYSPFGDQFGEESSGFGYNGEYYNAATGMIYLRARFYAPELNRFSQKDLLRGNVFDGGSLNRYLYCQNDPVDFADYNGRQMCAACVYDGGSGGSGKNKTSTSVPQTNTTDQSKGAAIVVSGKENDVNRFKYNFIESGIKGIKNYQEAGLTDITWIVFSYKYSRKDIKHFEATADSLGVNFVSVNSNQEFINYLNTGRINTETGTRSNKITDMKIYGHGHPGDLDLGKKKITQTDLMKLNPEIFDHTKTVLYTCQGANKSKADDGTTTDAIAQTISNITGGDTDAMYGKVDYAYIAYTKEELELKNELNDEIKRAAKQFILPKNNDNILVSGAKMLSLLFVKTLDDGIEYLRDEFGYLQEGALYDPIEGKQVAENGEERKPSYWMTFPPKN